MTLGALIALAAAVWLLSCAASVLARYWNIVAPAPRLRAAFISSGLALLLGYWGLGWIQLHASKTVNGRVEWSINSRWFFIGALVLGAASLALTLWNWRKASSRHAANPATRGACGHFKDEPSASKGGPATCSGDSGAPVGPPSVS